MIGTLYFVATPIGNLEDLTFRALRILKDEVSLIACEDTRHTLILLQHYGISKPLTSYHDHNKYKAAPRLIEELKKGASVALVTDAGTPGISDPGYHLLQRAIEENIPVVPIPGPSAVATALCVSGLPTDSFLFVGFVPRKSVGRRKFLASLKNMPCTLIFYESPFRVAALLEDVLSELGDRPVVISRELTKKFEEFIRGSASEIVARLSQLTLKGEFTIMVQGNKEKKSGYESEPDDTDNPAE